ncbi:MAG TPA: transcriptional regulator [Longimicrobiales bacterium]|nr:transcriptional regulator [Longimicrobiales bacterium]
MAERSRASRAEALAPPDAADRGGPRLRGHAGIAGAPAFDRLIHERMRLGMLSALAVNDVMSFNELKQVLDTTDGNLSVHARKLEEAEYVSCKKSFRARVPHTDYRITGKGRRALEHYLGHMEALIQAVRDG